MKLEQIWLLSDESQKVDALRQRETKLPDALELMKDWDPSQHAVMDNKLRKDGVKIIEPEQRDVDGKIIKAAVTEPDPVNRIPMPIEQDIINIHTSFTVGIEPSLTTDDSDESKDILSIVKKIQNKNKIKYHNKKVVRSWFAETEVCEYWYTVEDEGFWTKIFNFVKKAVSSKSTRKLKVALWSPFRGDKLYPKFDESGDLVAMSRGYKVKTDDKTDIEYFMTVTDKMVYKWINEGQWRLIERFEHKFSKMPIVYMSRSGSFCEKIKPLRERLETLLSNFADCIDYNFFPKLVMEGELEGTPSKGNGQMIKMSPSITGKASVYYLVWNQTPESVKMELDFLSERIYSLTNTPRISFENLKGMGSSFSGVSFRYTFMGAHMEVENHAEEVGLYLQRRVNFLVSAIGDMNTSYSKSSKETDVEVDIVPYMIDNVADKIKAAVDATGGPIASVKTGVILAGLTDDIDAEVKEIEADQTKKAGDNLYPGA